MADINVYFGTVTVDDTNGTAASNETGLTPVLMGIVADGATSSNIELACRCASGKEVNGNTVITPDGTNAGWWQLALNDGGSPDTYEAAGDPITITTLEDANVLFFAKVNIPGSTPTENDISVDLKIEANVITTL